MYVGLGKRGARLGYVARTTLVRPRSGQRARSLGRFNRTDYRVLGRLGQDDDWADVLTTGITTAGTVAAVAFKPTAPPLYSSITTPYGTSVQSYLPTMPGSVAPAGAGAMAGSSGAGSLGSLGSILPLALIGLLLVVAMK